MKAYKNLLILYIALISTSLFSFFGGGGRGALSGAAIGGLAGGRQGAAIGLGVGAFSDMVGGAAQQDYYRDPYYGGGRYHDGPYYDDRYYDDYYDGDRDDRQYRGRRPISKRY